jgi:hypothetical protein
MKNLLNLFGNLFGLAYEEMARIINNYTAKLKKASMMLGLSLLLAPVLLYLGSRSKIELLSIVGMTIIIVPLFYWLIIAGILIVLTRVAIRKLPKSGSVFAQEIARFFSALVKLAILWSAIAVYVVKNHAWENPWPFFILLALGGASTVVTVLVGDIINLKAWAWRINFMLGLTIVILTIGWLVPKDLLKKAAVAATYSFPTEIAYDSDNFDSIEFFDPITGKPKVWYWLITETGEHRLFNNDGYYHGTGGKLMPITPQVVNDIKRHLIKKRGAEAQKQIELQKLAEEENKKQEAARLREEQENKEKEEREIKRNERLKLNKKAPTEPAEKEDSLIAGQGPTPNLLAPAVVQESAPVPVVPTAEPTVTTQEIRPTPTEQIARPEPIPETPSWYANFFFVPPNTNLAVKLEEEINSEKHKAGQLFKASIDRTIWFDQEPIIKKGEKVIILAEMIVKGTPSQKAIIQLVLNALIRNNIGIQLSSYGLEKTADPPSKKEKVAKTGIGAAGGAIIGGILGGTEGAVIGGAVGAGGGAVVATKTDPAKVVIKKGEILHFTLSQELLIPKK